MKTASSFERNYPKTFAFRESLPEFQEAQIVSCPVQSPDGSLIADSETCGCGSENVVWSGDMYDCLDCGIFFADYAANPPHRRS